MAVQYSLFQNLPLELLEMIFQHLVRSPYSLHNLALTCRRIYDITIPALYSSICLTDPVRCEQLASTMQQSAWLSSLVQEIQVHFHNARTDQIHEALLDGIFEMHSLKSLSVRSVPLKGILDSTSHRLLNMLAKNDNIETESRTQYTGQRLRSLYLGEAFRIHADEPSWLLGPNEIVFYMEELEKLHIQGARIRPLHRATFGPRFPTKKTALKDLALLNCDVSPDTFAEILAFPKGLTHLTMKGRWLRTNGPFECSLNTSDYIKEIQRSSSAGVVYLDLDIWNPDDPPDDPPDFHHLEGLKHLTLSIEFYRCYIVHSGVPILSRFLPFSLETLILDGYNSMDEVFNLSVNKIKEGRFPKLRTIQFRGSSTGANVGREQTGIELEVEELRKLGAEFSLLLSSPSTMPENENWPCGWIYHRAAE